MALGRYVQLLDLIDRLKPKNIVEIGCWNGENAIRMLLRAEKYHENIGYIGYDLFEDATGETDAAELNVKRHCSMNEVEIRIREACPEADISLIKGNTRNTLKDIAADFCFIDGGHSVITIKSDHERLAKSKVIVHDDYYSPDENDEWPDIGMYGCNRLMEYLGRGEILPITDRVKGGGLVQMVLIENE